MQNPQYTITTSLPYEEGAAISEFATAVGTSRSKVIRECLRRALPVLVAEARARLEALQQQQPE